MGKHDATNIISLIKLLNMIYLASIDLSKFFSSPAGPFLAPQDVLFSGGYSRKDVYNRDSEDTVASKHNIQIRIL